MAAWIEGPLENGLALEYTSQSRLLQQSKFQVQMVQIQCLQQ